MLRRVPQSIGMPALRRPGVRPTPVPRPPCVGLLACRANLSSALRRSRSASKIALQRSPVLPLSRRPLGPALPRALPPGAPFHAARALAADHYRVLGLAKAASTKEVKLAYFKAARASHPDTARGKTPAEQAEAKKRFQEAANAYEVLSDPQKRSAYDREQAAGGFWGAGGQQQSQQQQQQQQANAQQQWTNVTSDAEVIEEAIHEYAEELAENAERAAQGLARGDFTEAWNFLKQHKGLVASVVLPTLLVFRFPGPVMAALRFLPNALLGVVALVVRYGGTQSLRMLWGLIGNVVTVGSSGAADVAREYTEQRRSLKAQRAQRRAEERSRAEDHARARTRTGRRTRHTK